MAASSDVVTSEVLDPGLAPFSTLPSLVGIEKQEMTEHVPIGGVSANTVNFQVQSSSAGWIDLANSYFHIALRIQKDVAAAISSVGLAGTGDDLLSAECHLPELLWSDVRVFMNSVDMSDDTSQSYPWIAFWKHALRQKASYGSSEERQVMAPRAVIRAQGTAPAALADLGYSSVVVEEDGLRDFAAYGGKLSPDWANVRDQSSSRATLWWKLRAYPNTVDLTTQNDILDIYWRPQSGMFDSQFKYLPPNVDMRIELTKGAPNLPFRSSGATSTDGFLIQNWDESAMRFYMRRVYPTSAVREELAAAALTGPYLYPFVRTRVSRITYPAGTQTIDETALLSGLKPNLVLVAFYDSRSFQKAYDGAGEAGQALGAFQSSGQQAAMPQLAGPTWPPNVGRRSIVPEVKELYIRYNGTQRPLVPYRQARETDKHRAYAEYVRNAAPDGPALSYDQFTYNFSCYIANFSEAGTRVGQFETDPKDRGSVTVHALLEQKPTQNGPDPPFTMFVMGMSDAMMTISADRTVRRIGF